MIDLTTNPVELSKIVRYGNGKHGKIENGTLTRDVDGGTETWPSTAYQLKPGDNYYQRLPTRLLATIPDTDAITAETAAGLEYFDDLIITGGVQIYGQGIGSNKWIYCGPSNTRWLCDAGFAGAWSNAISSTWSCKRFGELDVVAEEHTGSLTLADGQIPLSGKVASLNDVNEDGSQAIFVVKQNGDAAANGFLLVEVSETGGVPSMTVSVLRSWTQCQGTCSDGDVISGNYSVILKESYVRDPATDPTPPTPPCSAAPHWTVTQTPAFYFDTIASYSPSSPPGVIYVIQDRVLDYSRTGRIVGMYFKNNTIEEITLDYISHYEAHAQAPTIEQGGSNQSEWQWIDNGFGVCIKDEISSTNTVYARLHRTTTATLSLTITLNAGTTSQTLSFTKNETIVNNYDYMESSSYVYSYTRQSDISYSYPGSAGSYTAWNDSGVDSTIVFDPNTMPYLHSTLIYCGDGDSSYMYDPQIPFKPSSGGPIEPDYFTIDWLSNNLCALRYTSNPGTGYINEPLEYRTGLAGIADSSTELIGTPNISNLTDPKLYASYNPRDGRLAESSNPVNWV